MARLGLLSLCKALLVVFLFGTCAFAQTAQDNIWSWDDYSGGLDLKTAPSKLDKRHGDIAENIRFNEARGSIFKRKDILVGGVASADEPITGMHRLYVSDGTKALIVTHGDSIQVRDDTDSEFSEILTVGSGGYRWQLLTWHDLAIGTDGYNQPVKYDGSSTSATYLGSCLATVSDDAGGPTGTYNYKVTFYTDSYEVGFGQVSNSIAVTNKQIALSLIPIGPITFLSETVLGRKIYRNKHGETTYYLLSNGTIQNNTATTLTDVDIDSELGSSYATDLDEQPPKGKLSIVHQDRLWLANDPSNPSRLYYSYIGSHDYFPADNYYDIRKSDGDEITFLREFHGILTVSKNNSIQKVYTNVDSVSWEISGPFNFNGCHAIYSAADSVYGVIYLAKDGIYVFNGQYSKLLSDKVSPVIEDISDRNFGNAWGVVHKNKYYLSYCSKASGFQINNRLLVYEIPSDTYSIDLLEINALCRFSSGDDINVLYYGSSRTGAVYASTEEGYGIIHKKHSDFDDGTFSSMRYIPTGIPGGDANSPVLEISRGVTIDQLTGTIDALVGTIDRAADSGTYTSPAIRTNMSSFEFVRWNEIIPPSGGSVSVAIRTSDDGASWGDWSAEYSTAAGSDISALTAKEYTQYRITMSTDDLQYSPIMYNTDNFVIRVDYGVEGVGSGADVPMRWRSGWLDFGYPARIKVLRRIECFYSGKSDNLELTFENYDGDTDVFTINLEKYPKYHIDSFSTGGFPGNLFRLTIKNDGLNPLTIDKIIVVFDIKAVH